MMFEKVRAIVDARIAARVARKGLCGDSPLKNVRLLGFRAAFGACLKIRDERSDLSSRFLRH